MSRSLEDIPSGHPLQSSLQAIYARRGLTGDTLATVRGTLDRATLKPSPAASPVALAGPLYLVDGTVLFDGAEPRVMAVVSWSDNGLPRMAAGLLDDGISAGVKVVLPGEGEAAPAARSRRAAAPAMKQAELVGLEAPDDDVPPWEAEPAPAARNRAPEPAPRAEDAHVDLSAEMAALSPDPSDTPAPGPAKASAPSGGGWAAAVAASKPPSGGSRRGARSAGRSTPRTPPTASDLGFDVDGDPDLRRGDILLHPRFGRCKVIKASDAKVKVRRASGAFIDLHLKVCSFTRLPDEDGTRVFDVRIGRKR